MSVSYSRTAFRSFLRLGNANRGMVRDAVEMGSTVGFADRELPGGTVARTLDNGMRVIFSRARDETVILAIQSTSRK